ncbi:OsmC family peroxiredoxin [Flavobacterium rakeshii]|uniref:OsmC family peroxiredoxin n=1 Tax=Flavobacterium rakeshii TaxID=1038845 RepID=A0A6N8HEY4_9FLAO|nr:OsmC family protein [Flavobacterium rakeshii]MUV04271.1 OsmC family peroxiredoxin [Flavobacterium rakeshii]
MKTHHYSTQLQWTGNRGSGTKSYTSYTRDYDIQTEGKPVVLGSSDPAFRGDSSRYNPEEMLLASLSSCHMLWYLHLCSEAGIIITAYKDNAVGEMEETPNGSGRFVKVILRPVVTVQEEGMLHKANELHQKANEMCFIANSCNFPVLHEPESKV